MKSTQKQHFVHPFSARQFIYLIENKQKHISEKPENAPTPTPPID